MFKIKLPTKCIFWIFPIFRINGMELFCNLSNDPRILKPVKTRILVSNQLQHQNNANNCYMQTKQQHNYGPVHTHYFKLHTVLSCAISIFTPCGFRGLE